MFTTWSVIQAVLEIFFRIRVLNEHQTGGCMTIPPPAPGRHHHTQQKTDIDMEL